MPWTEGKKETGQIILDGQSFDVSRVVTEQIGRFIETPEGFKTGNVWEILRKGREIHNKAFVLIDGEWIKGHTEQRRWTSGDGRPERQNIFVSSKLNFVLTSGRITV